MQRGIDVSHWQGKMNWNVAKSAGVQFAFCKATDFVYGTANGFVDRQLDNNIHGAKSVGIAVGMYHWLQPFPNGDKQAEFFLEQYDKYKPDLPPVLDFEDNRFINPNDYLYYAQEWLYTVEAHTKTLPIIYTGAGFLKKFDPKKIGWMSKYPLWLAQYPLPKFVHKIPIYRPKAPYPFSKWLIWQYTDKGDGKFYGAESLNIDLNLAEEEITTVTTEPKPMVKIIAYPSLRVREQPNLTSKILKTLPHQSYTTVEEDLGEWYKIPEGYIYKKYTQEV